MIASSIHRVGLGADEGANGRETGAPLGLRQPIIVVGGLNDAHWPYRRDLPCGNGFLLPAIDFNLRQ
jgi:hypothetical protein